MKNKTVIKRAGGGKQLRKVNRADLTVSDAPTLFGCELLFDHCTDEALMSLSFEGTAPFLDWLGWQKTDVCVINKAFINFVRAEREGGNASPGWLADPCADPNTYEVDYCDFTLTDFARIRRGSPTRDITKSGLRYCETQPRFRLDGSPITSEIEYDFRLAVEVLIQDLKIMVVEGNKNTEGQFDGLERLVKTGYLDSDGSRCEMMDSIIINYNHSTINEGGNGMTWNGDAIDSGFNFIDILTAVVRRIRHRIRMAPALASQRMNVGDMVLVLPEEFAPCLLDAFNCYSFCGGDETILNTKEARQNRNELNGGAFGAGQIEIDGLQIPLMPFDWGLINSGATFDAYLLTGAVGNQKILHGQYNDLQIAQTERGDKFFATDGGRLLNWSEDDHTCVVQIAEMQPRILNWAPWAQARFQNVVCATPGGVISADPNSGYFPY